MFYRNLPGLLLQSSFGAAVDHGKAAPGFHDTVPAEFCGGRHLRTLAVPSGTAIDHSMDFRGLKRI